MACAWRWIAVMWMAAVPTLGSATTWSWVASENQTFTVSGTQTARYGIEGQWVTKTVSGTVPCTNDYFGSDPAYGSSKSCYVSSDPTPATTWTFVASENQTFTVSGTQTARYGIEGLWVTKTVSGTVPCTNDYFGSDPAYGFGKSCYVSGDPTLPPAPAPAPAPAPGVILYTTNFPWAENVISEGGRWINGGSGGVKWNDVSTTVGMAFGSTTVSGYDDDIAIITGGFAANQWVQATVSRASGYWPGVSHEIELLLNFQISPNDARGYEVLWDAAGALNIVRWNGPLGDYTPLLDTSGPNVGAAVDGDVLRAEISNGVIKVFKNGSLLLTGPQDSTFTTGSPGIGFWPLPGSTPSMYGWKSFSAGNL